MITILLSTYNGARFLAEQLASFEQQTDRDWRLIWRDDGSTDDTVAIMEEFSTRTKRCRRVEETVVRLGPTASFLLLLKEASHNLGREDIVMFSDQDDVWLPDKLEKAKTALMSNSFYEPALYFAGQKLVDSSLNHIGYSTKINFLPLFPDCLTQNVAIGCTVALNHEAVKLINKSHAPINTYHDWWSYIVVSAHGGRCIYDDSNVILYRQHSSNTIGAQKSSLKRAIGAVRRGPSHFMNGFWAHIDALASDEAALNKKSKKFVVCIKNAKTNKLKLFFAILQSKIKRQNNIETILFYVWILLGRCP